MITDGPALAVAASALGMAIYGAWLHWPRPPELEGERWFKVILSTMLRGKVEAADGEADAWVASVKASAPYHPAGRLPEVKVSLPQAGVGAPALEGEVALVEALVKHDGQEARWKYMYEEDEVGLLARLDDPAELGPAYDLATWLGPELSWERVAAVGAGELGALAAGLRNVVVVVVGEPVDGAPDLRESWASLWPAAVFLAGGAPTEAGASALAERLRAVGLAPGQGLLLVGLGLGAPLLVRALAGAVDVRDRTVAVLSVGGALGGLAGSDWEAEVARDWMAQHFRHEALDTELVRLTPYLAVAYREAGLEPAGLAGLGLAAQRWPALPSLSQVEPAVRVMDLGLLPSGERVALREVAAALLLVTAACAVALQGPR